jgi:hypothetical protein
LSSTQLRGTTGPFGTHPPLCLAEASAGQASHARVCRRCPLRARNRASNLSSLATSHSHIDKTVQPSCRSVFSCFASRSLFAATFGDQYVWLDFTPRVPSMHIVQPCQKHPWTNTQARCLAKTKSGLPGRSERWSRYRRPFRYKYRRTAISGVVSLARMRDMFQLRLDAVSLSAIERIPRSATPVSESIRYALAVEAALTGALACASCHFRDSATALASGGGTASLT